MKYFGEGLSDAHKALNKIIRKEDEIEQAKALFLNLHRELHLSEVSEGVENEVDRLLGDLKADEYAIMPTGKDETIAWVLWHIARIEDLTMGILVGGGNQLFDDGWKQRMNSPITDTGNSLSDGEIMDLSRKINVTELLHYRNEVGIRTRNIVKNLSSADMRTKVPSSGLDKILSEGGVTKQEDSVWLLDFWGKKDVAGILLMPPTRHIMLHLNDCCKWKEYIRTKKRYHGMSDGSNQELLL
ncbi:MAG TPA: DinB family protein [Lachnoclostridium sp.]|uniref:DinB family protein n=1 Tax=[Clostridium] celerecrescens 18A TaxID=1286362 RepID=A0A2M8Z4V6_9FIRM|nr:DinB family protein [Lacrimispora celerecrescens]PJJ28474.1 DinB family protein [[Clostridium] celerecrescens 18A]HBE87093.1 DinB family protein [Lachnoclostridium sp.]